MFLCFGLSSVKWSIKSSTFVHRPQLVDIFGAFCSLKLMKMATCKIWNSRHDGGRLIYFFLARFLPAKWGPRSAMGVVTLYR